MKLFESIQFRIVVAYTALIITAMGAIGIYLITSLTSENDSISADDRIFFVMAFIMFVALFSIAMGIFIANRTSKSVKAVTTATIKLADGDFNQRVQAISSDETRSLVEAFNNMAGSVRTVVTDLSSERNKLSALLNTMGDGVILIRKLFFVRQGEGLIELMNASAEKLLGVEPLSSIGKRFTETVKDDALQKLVYNAMETNEHQNGDVELTNPVRHISANVTPLGSENGNGALLTLHDLTRIRQVDIIRKQFVSNVSHELRSPLAAIQAMVETLADGALEEPKTAKEFIARIHAEIERMNNIVADLLDLSELDNDEQKLELASLDMVPLIRQSIHSIESQASTKRISVVEDLPEGLPQVLGQQSKLRQVLDNLLDNAVKFTPPKGIIKVSAYPYGETVRTAIEDNGIGIPEDAQSHVFERFFRADSSRSYKGTGLGLAIVKHIIQAHRGDIDFDSEPERGTVFHFDIPLYKQI